MSGRQNIVIRVSAKNAATVSLASRIANTRRSAAGKRGGETSEYEQLSKGELQDRARKTGIEGRSKMNKGELIDALRNHWGVAVRPGSTCPRALKERPILPE
jgi:hypothetical protein